VEILCSNGLLLSEVSERHFLFALGAFGAHGLEGRLAERMMKNFQTGVQYQMYHSLGLVLVGLIALENCRIHL